MLRDYKYDEYLDSPQQLAKRIIDRLQEENEITFPIDPFKLLSMNGIVYQFRDFKELEGIYIAPLNQEDIPIVGINYNRPIPRQRFTAAHELCHHIKDRSNEACPIGGHKDAIEKFADQFASELLMPRGYFEAEAQKYLIDGKVTFDDALKLSLHFGVSFESCVFTLAYRCNFIEGNTHASELKKRFRKYKPQNKLAELGLLSFDPCLREQIINSYTYFYKHDFNLIWNIFKNDYIYNESRIEGSHLNKECVAEIITDLRLHKQESEFCKSDLQDIIETAGQSDLYDYIFDTTDKISTYLILKLHSMLYRYAPHHELAGSFRENNNFVTESKFETCDHKDIFKEIISLNDEVQELMKEKDEISMAMFIERTVKIHHKLTIIHPFDDGNGRIARVFLNWLFKIKGLPPVYLKYESKERYYDALQCVDLNNDYEQLKEVFFTEIVKTMMQIYDGRRIFED